MFDDPEQSYSPLDRYQTSYKRDFENSHRFGPSMSELKSNREDPNY